MWQHCLATHLSTNESFNLFNVYGPTVIGEKRDLWNLLSDKLQSTNVENCILVKDFNAILVESEKKGGIQRLGTSQKDFQYFVDNNHLMDIIPKNGTFTWTNRRTGFTSIAERLDRFLMVGNWLGQNHLIESSILSLVGSDHSPICLTIDKGQFLGRALFRFEKMWVRDPAIQDLILKWWNELELGNHSRLFKLNQKLRYIKIKVKEWNLTQFKDIHKEKIRITTELEEVANFVTNLGMDVSLFQKEKGLKSDLNEILRREEIH